jgi:hypothetical protein
MMTIATSRYRNARRPCRSPIGHSAACLDRQFGPLWKRLLTINASTFGRNDLLSSRISADQCARATRHNSHTAYAALKSP